jgi:hypothetical protein
MEPWQWWVLAVAWVMVGVGFFANDKEAEKKLLEKASLGGMLFLIILFIVFWPAVLISRFLEDP